MINLEKLVPPLELCQKIPAGEFEDSAHWYRWSYIDQKYLLDASKPDVCLYREPCPCGMKYFYPRSDLAGDHGSNAILPGVQKTTATFIAVHEKTRFAVSKNGATAALKLWLKLKGIENESY